MDDVRAHTGILVADLLLPHAGSLKERRRALRAVVQRLRNREFSVAQVGPADLHQRAFLAVTAVSGSASELAGMLDVAERILFASEFEVAAVHRDGSLLAFPSTGA